MIVQHGSSTVLQGDCAQCGFEAATVGPGTAVDTIRGLGDHYENALLSSATDEALLRRRPRPTTWSALEYAAHVRDVIALWGWALHRTLTDDRPRLPDADADLPDRTASEADYNRQDSLVVQRELAANADRMAKKIATIGGEQWQRAALFGELQVTALDIVRKVAHEGHHHLLDIERSLRD